ncbi:5'/3'-nucleotidase SurE [Silvimonas iriomotensis]|nr:5'/3'-nucleotidase SurE [Silvimonas iriomotensis]
MPDSAPYHCQRILITNDDGIDAPGLAVLEHIARLLAPEVWIVAPAADQSGTGTSISLQDPLRIKPMGERRYAVTGTPADCVAVGVGHLLQATPPDLILSGVNRGANLGIETFFSGTVGAAMTGLMMGIRSIALSQKFTDGAPVRWETASTHGADVIRQISSGEWPAGVCLNINFPDVPPEQVKEVRISRQGRGLLNGVQVRSQQDPRGFDYQWLKLQRAPQPDADDAETPLLGLGHITITPLGFDRTAAAALSDLARKLD